MFVFCIDATCVYRSHHVTVALVHRERSSLRLSALSASAPLCCSLLLDFPWIGRQKLIELRGNVLG